MKFGLSSDQYQYIYDTVYKPLSSLGAKIYCYGSRARGDHNPFSDLDLMVEANANLKIESEISRIEEQLQKSNFPYKVDLVLLSHFADSYKDGYEHDKISWV